ncbi:hypothetical protein LOTGIDRAFT_168918 [Lottia gigantea]|uniref:Laminin G domain-containing protein n=1 Tax=Lottia gigantea TaxID=225164 RepID=V3Z0A2_LOTGI|nr:hypothetical protein LOTGIDRAFT_168918 [Lottia gigantea]ESO83873.1 hypothetical protein LOTGIDRAFT_168918 [Lottia gigantea]
MVKVCQKKHIFGGAFLLLAAMLHSSTSEVTGRKTQVFVNQTSSALILSKSWNLRSWTRLSFRTCSFNGELLSQEDSSGQFLNLRLKNGSLVFSWNISNIASSVSVQGKYNTNKWVTVSFRFFLGEVYFNVTQGQTVLHSSIIASLTTNQYLLMHNVNSVELKVGRTIVGCINQGPGVDFNLAVITATNVIWNNCSVSSSLGCTLGM